jgi:hypothetical protein
VSEQTRNNFPSRKLFPQWVNKSGSMLALEQEHNKGAFWVWKEPVEGHEYIIGADVAEGQGENNDNSCFQILDTSTLEQVGEFYSNLVVPYEFAQILNEVSIYYNNALLVVENMGPGSAVLSSLQHTLFYDNLYFENQKNSKAGVKIGATNRPLYLEALQNRLMNETIRINSARFANELSTFEYNPVTKKAQAQKNRHDDAIMAMCIALYIRDTMLRDLPMGAETPRESTAIIKAQVFEEIKRELMEGKIDDFMDKDDIDLLMNTEAESTPAFAFRRSHDRILKEFGW